MHDGIPIPTLRRLPSYLRLLRDLGPGARTWISCTHFAKVLHLDATQVRKDLACTGIVGRPKVGYQVEELVAAIERCLGWHADTDAVLVGMGNLGRALLGFTGFSRHGLNIVAAFDNDPARSGIEMQGKPVYAMTRLAEMVARHRIRLGILTVPEQAAEQAAQAMREAGITAIWNYTPVKLDLEGLIVEDVDLAASLGVLTHRLSVDVPTEAAAKPPMMTMAAGMAR
jgi:redox-sensing transcriptional repressor